MPHKGKPGQLKEADRLTAEDALILQSSLFLFGVECGWKGNIFKKALLVFSLSESICSPCDLWLFTKIEISSVLWFLLLNQQGGSELVVERIGPRIACREPCSGPFLPSPLSPLWCSEYASNQNWSQFCSWRHRMLGLNETLDFRHPSPLFHQLGNSGTLAQGGLRP